MEGIIIGGNIKEKREAVRKALIKQSSNINGGRIERISTEDLKALFYLYDDIFFSSYFENSYKGSIKFSLSTKMTRAAGKTISPKNIDIMEEKDITYEIRMGINFFFKYYETGKEKVVAGINTRDALEAFQIVFEHELSHLIELHNYHTTSCRQDRFKKIAKDIFGHTDTRHYLPTNMEIANDRYGIKVGQEVNFMLEGKSIQGIISAINKRATVMVRDNNGIFFDSNGNKYLKFYVPLNLLKKAGN
jgi:predicted SprT family Zn-dependent metalloprotease